MQLQARGHEQLLRIERRHAHAQHAHRAQVQVGRLLDGVAQARAQRLRAVAELLGHRREPHAAHAALEEREAQLLLQPLQALGHRGLRHAQLGRGTPRLPVPGDGEEVVDVVEPHGHGAGVRVLRNG